MGCRQADNRDFYISFYTYLIQVMANWCKNVVQFVVDRMVLRSPSYTQPGESMKTNKIKVFPIWRAPIELQD